jgi:hypothetical protein
MLTRTRLVRITHWIIVSSCLTVATGLSAENTTSPAKSDTDVEMSTISGEPATPRRHSRLRNPQTLDPERAAEIYAIARAGMKVGYALSGLEVARDYQTWRRYNSAPYLSATHGNHYLNNYANEIARTYGDFEGAGRLPVGSVIAKDSFSVTESDGILLGALFIMEKMPQGFSYVSGDWKFTLVKPDGTIFGETNGAGSARVEYCITCHLSRERYDHLYFVPKAFRR